MKGGRSRIDKGEGWVRRRRRRRSGRQFQCIH